MRTALTHGTVEGSRVQKTPNIVAPNHVHPFAGSSGHDDFQEHTHSSSTLGSLSRSLESFNEVFASPMNASTVDGKQENHVEAFKDSSIANKVSLIYLSTPLVVSPTTSMRCSSS